MRLYFKVAYIVASVILFLYFQEVLGFHTNMGFVNSGKTTLLELIASFFPSLIVESKYADRLYPLSKRYSTLLEEMGYMHLQATKPDTVGKMVCLLSLVKS